MQRITQAIINYQLEQKLAPLKDLMRFNIIYNFYQLHINYLNINKYIFATFNTPFQLVSFRNRWVNRQGSRTTAVHKPESRRKRTRPRERQNCHSVRNTSGQECLSSPNPPERPRSCEEAETPSFQVYEFEDKTSEEVMASSWNNRNQPGILFVCWTLLGEK